MANADPVARRIVFGCHVVPKTIIEGEETAVKHREFQTSPGGVFGGSGIATINKDQLSDKWTSMPSAGLSTWENFTELNWEDAVVFWENTSSGHLTITTTASDHQLSSDSNDLAFLYIKNTGSTYNCEVSLNGSSGNFFIIIPPNGSVCLRGDGTRSDNPDGNLDCNDVYVRSSSSTTTIEYILAKE